MNFIKKIIDNEVDNSVHLQFQKFSKGEFDNRAVVAVRKTKNKFTISTTSEFANEFVRSVAEELGEEKTSIKGAIISTSNLKEEIEYKENLMHLASSWCSELNISGFIYTTKSKNL